MNSNGKMRTFEDKPAVRGRSGLLLGIVGPSSSGKTYSAMRLGVGIQRVMGGELFVVDTENGRALQYADKFSFRHVDFQPPFGPLDYLAAIQHCITSGAKVIVVDSMTHEHSGEGGVMDQSDTLLDKKCGNDWKARKNNFMFSLIEPKKQRKKLNAFLARLDPGVTVILCYRADEKIKPVKGADPLELGWQPETTSKLHYEMMQRFLLGPGSDGVPTLNPQREAERMLVKNPEQFRGWFKPGDQLSEDLGERMARWAAGDVAPTASARHDSTPPPANGPVFRGRRDGQWTGKPLNEAPIDVLRQYRDATAKAVETAKNEERREYYATHLVDVEDAIEAAEADEELGSFDTETGEVAANG